MATINLMKWNAEKGLVEKTFEIPTNVISENLFAENVQVAMNYFTNERLSDKVDNAQNSYETEQKKPDVDVAKLDKLYKAYIEADEEYSRFRKAVPVVKVPADAFATAYTVSVVGIGSHIEVVNFYDTYISIIRYGHDFQLAGMEKWTDARKDSFSGLKDSVNAFLAYKFQIKEQAKEAKEQGEQLIYKPFNPSFVNREIERIVSAVYGKVETATGNSKTSGTALKHMTEEQAFIYIIREMFHKYGCAVDTTKKKKTTFVF